jgi:AraC family transcriptional regulator of arabinose operon
MIKSSLPSVAAHSGLSGYDLAAKLSPFVRAGLEHWRGPWIIERAIILDYLLVYIVSGTGRFTVGQQSFEAGPGDLIWIPPDTYHEMRGYPPRMLVAYLHFDLVYDPERSPLVPRAPRFTDGPHDLMHPKWLEAPISGWSGLLPTPNGAEIHRLMKRTIFEHRGSGHPLSVSGLMLQVIGEIAAGLSASVTSAGAHWPAIRSAAEEILARPEVRRGLAQLAREARLSVSHFRKLFREAHGQTWHAMQDRALMQKACELVLHSGWSITRIAAELRFSNVHNFSRAFTREIGISPSSYRREMLGLRAD